MDRDVTKKTRFARTGDGSMQRVRVIDTALARRRHSEGDFTGVVALYDPLYEQEIIHSLWSAWDYYFFAHSLQRLGQYERSQWVAVQGMERYPAFSRLSDVYCWCVYYVYVRDYREGYDEFRDLDWAVGQIVHYCGQSPYTPYARALWKMVAVLRQRRESADVVDSYLACLDGDLLPMDERRIETDDGTKVVSSEREQWYALRSRYLLEMGRYDECIALCKEALRVFPEFHHDNERWLFYRMALCQVRLGQAADGRRQLEELAVYHPHWMVYRGLFEAAEADGDTEAMLKYGASALLAEGDMASKVVFLETFGDFLDKRKQYAMAFLHYVLVEQVRRGKRWRTAGRFERKIASYAFTRPTEKILQERLYAFWVDAKHSGDEAHFGVIDQLLPGGSGGFIQPDIGKRCSFSASTLHVKKPYRGMKVQFYYDEKGARAIDIIERKEAGYHEDI